MNNKTIGLISLCSSPFLAIDFMVHGGFDNHIPTSLGGLFNLIYMTGWFLCILTLYQMHARTKKIVRIVFATQVVFLCLAEISNLWSIVQPVSNNNLFTILDLFWPVSNGFMFFTGLTILLSKKITGWQRYIPLFVGLWLPATIASSIIMGNTPATVVFISIYSAVAWSLLALSVYTNNQANATQEVRLSTQTA